MTERKAAILAVDEGTSGTRAALVWAYGTVSPPAYIPLAVATPRHGVVEQDANIILEQTLVVCRQVIAQAREMNVEIVALALTTQRATGVLWDTETGRALVPAMVWQDTRYAEELKPLAAVWDSRLVPLTGRPAGARSLYLWAARHIQNTPEVKAARQAGRLAFGTVDTWLLWHLSDERRCVTTPTNATSCGSYVLGEHRFLTDWVEAQDFPPDLLPSIMQDADDFGQTRRDLLGIRVPIKASSGDQLAGLIGLGCHEVGQAMCVHGTGSFVDLMIGQNAPQKPGHFETTFTMTAWRQHGVSHFAVETYAPTTGSALNWLCSQLRWFTDPKEISDLATTVSSAEGLTLTPFLTGLRQPRIMPTARAALTGLSMAHTRAHLAYAALEGVAQSVVSCAEASQTVAGVPVRSVIAGGGLSSSAPLLQMQADLGGVPVRCMPDADRASLRGAAFLAGTQGLFWSDLAEARRTLPEGELFMPAIGDDERNERRSRWQALIEEEIGRTEAGLYS